MIAFRKQHPILRQKRVPALARAARGRQRGPVLVAPRRRADDATQDWADPELRLVVRRDAHRRRHAADYAASEDAIFAVFNAGDAVEVRLPDADRGAALGAPRRHRRPRRRSGRRSRAEIQVAAQSVVVLARTPTNEPPRDLAALAQEVGVATSYDRARRRRPRRPARDAARAVLRGDGPGRRRPRPRPPRRSTRCAPCARPRALPDWLVVAAGRAARAVAARRCRALARLRSRTAPSSAAAWPTACRACRWAITGSRRGGARDAGAGGAARACRPAGAKLGRHAAALRPAPGRAGGIGDYADLGRAVAGARPARRRASSGVNPVHAGFPEDPNAISPYSPSHRRRLNVLHVASTDDEDPGGEPDRLYRRRAASSSPRSRPRSAASARRGGDRAFDGLAPPAGRQPAAPSPSTRRCPNATAPTGRNGRRPTAIPTRPRSRPSPPRPPTACASTPGCSGAPRPSFADAARAAGEAGMTHGLYLDLAVGTHPARRRDLGRPGRLRRGVSLGAPPDAFSAEGPELGPRPAQPARAGGRGLHAAGRDAAHASCAMPGCSGSTTSWGSTAPSGCPRRRARHLRHHAQGGDAGGGPDRGAPRRRRHRRRGSRQRPRGPAATTWTRRACSAAAWRCSSSAAHGGFRRPRTGTPRALASFGTHDLPTYAGWRVGRDIDWRQKVGDIDRRTAPQGARGPARATWRGFDAAVRRRRRRRHARFLGAHRLGAGGGADRGYARA